ncbi:MAG: glutamate 5-kinase [Candidatus Omnitrophota bacterium]|nr:glutamate 5-kinase [Candidatus Omnitrophota bacterium]MBU2221953.1 glutamate 5-kinase [Candidatus Omnitrophota bacterium]
MQLSEKNYKRIVVKVGSSLFCSADGTLEEGVLESFTRQISALFKQGKEVIVVSSGAIAMGMHVLGMKKRPKDLASLQAAAAVGQNELMHVYRKFFGKGWFGGQILLTRDDFNDRKRYLNARHTIEALLKKRNYRVQGVVPIINENDTVATDEIKFGDNDRLSAMTAVLVCADLLVILSDVDGLLDENKKVVRKVYEITPAIKAMASPTKKQTSVGGMITKIEAAKIAADSGIPCVIANGRKKNIILSVVKTPEKCGTLFVPK